MDRPPAPTIPTPQRLSSGPQGIRSPLGAWVSCLYSTSIFPSKLV